MWTQESYLGVMVQYNLPFNMFGSGRKRRTVRGNHGDDAQRPTVGHLQAEKEVCH